MQPQQKTNHSKHLQTQTRNFELNSTEWHPTQPHSAACRAVVSCRSHDRGGEQTVRAASTAPRCARRVRTLSTELHAIEAAGPAGSLLGGHWRSVPSSRRRRVRAYPRDGARAPAAGRSARSLRCARPQRSAASRPSGRASYSTSPSKRASTFGSIAATPTAPDATSATTAPSPPRPSAAADSKTFTEAEANAALREVRIEMYATTWCGSCRRAREYLDFNGIAYTR